LKITTILALAFLFATFCLQALAATEYVIANDNGSLYNTLSVYELDTNTGVLTQAAFLATGGLGLGVQFQDQSNNQQAVSSNGACLFALNAGSSDIASFSRATHFTLVGNYSDPALIAGNDGGITVTPDGKFLYGSYGKSGNVGAWAINQDCSLTFVNSYTPSAGSVSGALKVAPNGNELIVAVGDRGDTFSVNRTDGTLTDLGYLSFVGSACPIPSCDLFAIDITKDSRVAIFSSYYLLGNGTTAPIALAAQLTANGLAKPRGWTLQNSSFVNGNDSVFLGADGYAGSGNLYFGMGNGIITTNFTEKPLKISVMAATLIHSTTNVGTTIAVTGNRLIQAWYPNEIFVYMINSDGSVSQLSTTTVSNPNAGMFSLSVFPVTR